VKVAGLILAITNPIVLLIGIAAALGVYWGDIWRGIKIVVEESVSKVVYALGVLAVAWQIIWGAVGPIVRGAVQFAIGWIENLIGAIETIISVAQRAADALSKLKGAAPSLKNPVPFFDPGGFLPGHASGGLVTSPHLAMVGEAGPELILPLNRLGGIGTTIYNVTVQTSGLGASSPQIQSAVAAALRNYQDRNGR
jgi:hypothetical protein